MKSFQSKKVKKRLALIFILIIVLGIIGFVIYRYSLQETEPSFKINRVVLKSVIKEGEDLNTSFVISNWGQEDDFYLEISNLGDLVFLEKNNLTLASGESEEIEISFSDSVQGVYVGSLTVRNSLEQKSIPIILEIQSIHPLFAISLDVDSKYKEVKRGEEFFGDVNFVNLRDNNEHLLEVSYMIFDSEGNIIISETDSITAKSKFSVTKSLPIPKKANPGNYVFAVVGDSELSVTTSSYLFKVVRGKIFPSDFNLSYWLIGIFLFFIIVIVFYILYERNKFLLELKRQHGKEIKVYAGGIDEERKKSLDTAKTEKEREKILGDFEEAKKEVLNEIKKQQFKQKSELKKLKETKGDELIKKKLQGWKKGVYPKALEAAKIDQELKMKLMTLERAYSEGYISKESYKKGSSRIKSADRKVKRKSL